MHIEPISPRHIHDGRRTRRWPARALWVAFALFVAVGMLRGTDAPPAHGSEAAHRSSWIAAAFPVGQAGFAHAASVR